MRPRRLLGPEKLAEAPELATLELLEVALALATNALLAENGELGCDDFIAELAAAPAIHACLADAILNHINALQRAIDRYRDYTDAVPTPTLPNPDF